MLLNINTSSGPIAAIYAKDPDPSIYKPPKTFGGTWNTHEILINVINSASGVTEMLDHARGYHSRDEYFLKARKLVFENSIDYWSYIPGGGPLDPPQKSDRNLQASMIV
jgi:hypothetical protein